MADLEILFGKIAQELELLTKEQAEECAELQRQEGGSRHIGQIAIDKKYIDREDVVEILTAQLLRFYDQDSESGPLIAEQLFGQIAVSHNFITFEQLNEALNHQASLSLDGKPAPLGQVLVDTGILTEDKVQEILNAQETPVQERLKDTLGDK